MRTWMVGFVIALGAAACGKHSPNGGDVDAPPGTLPDAPAVTSGAVACGEVGGAMSSCPLPGQACCEFQTGVAPDYCYSLSVGLCDGGTPFRCDGPEDCAGGAACCYVAGTGASCTTANSCNATAGAIMCHVGDDSPCGGGVCCPLDIGGPTTGWPYGTCRGVACPV